ncbi:Rhodocoxin reductase [Achromobacter denitrificans]|uniref:FAD/NAD(P)-dependent oxidoreductase n=1 Tax=Achromobacter denitrificans TaxID=32002 RepID=UPI000788B838|nr:NAD(P)/FAD-dependent oxidoreductase [Achromobacter denitrificans]OLU10122.1 FAD/NAD(P)-binding oxidoreductase [Achromobacter denitrificans]QKH44247.1 FAD-dependent oxidoreductase [Achromobacter denitrificans]QKH48612.1 FAD-dependent oxidoreductase [Achromobacter denitrificans]CAB3668161.1 Hydrogen cyanide synthase subunit HcnB [Achromobacter denitrificans]SUU07706.1 Rhodocoxin reductase [Achromobacter denitrificans]
MIDTTQCDLLVVGAGPAGLAAATLAAKLGVDTVLLDEQPAPGGQIYRAITTTPVTDRAILGEDYWHGASLVGPFQQSGARYVPGATVWAVAERTAPQPENGFEVAYSVAGEARIVHARRLLLATGAQERPFPIPGWTLPGVITAGAAQILLKSAGVVPADRTVLAGSGPLLYLVAWQYLNAGVKIDALLETTPPGRMSQALPKVWGFLRSPYLGKGLKLLRAVKAAVPITRGVTALEALGDGKLQSVRYTADGVSKTLPADQLMLHQGVVPNVNLSRAVGAEHRWNDALDCWEPQVDEWGLTSVEGIGMAGDGAGIAGALAAEHRGRLAALQAAHLLGRIDAAKRDGEAAAPRAALARAVRGREFFDALYKTPDAFRRPTGDTIVCRCEEVTAAQVRDTVKLGCSGPNQMKAFLRCGMGPCQGRFCGLTVSEIIAEERGVPTQEVGYYRLRFPTKPLTLGELASLPQTDDSRQAVVRLKK